MENAAIQAKIKYWTENDYFDPATRQELLAIKDPQELAERFGGDLEFGTAGIRGILGAGTNRLNIYWIRRVAQGLADTIKEEGPAAVDRGVVIAYDCRRYSREFALESALVLAANGIKAYLFESLRPTPELSFAIRHLNTIAGIMITASHNPKEYNGCKVYWEDGGQVPPEQADRIVAKMKERDTWVVERIPEREARAKGLLVDVGEEVDAAYLAEVKEQLLNLPLIREKGPNLTLVFTPLHGTGSRLVPRLLQDIGFTSLVLVEEQMVPDPEFATVSVPNPEEPEAFQLALAYAREHRAGLILACDPDADRLGVMVRDREGTYHKLTGNQIGVLLLYYLLSQRQEQGILPADGVVMKSIVSTDLAGRVATAFGVKMQDVLVGFKYIGEQIKLLEERGSGTFLFGFEESHGYLAGTYARDKDAVAAAALTAEAALYFREVQGKSLLEVLEEIYRTHGYYLDEQVALAFPGLEGKERINRLMANLRAVPGKTLGGVPLESLEDYLSGKGRRMEDGEEYALSLPQANLLRFRFQGGGYAMARPSGTEPKIRFYFCVRGQTRREAEEKLAAVKEEFLQRAGVSSP
ncbi:MAG TPA: phospho-sugar mutase [Clostridia bacterium]|nr:phospho-sugar mutase [Clostridia bacterium]